MRQALILTSLLLFTFVGCDTPGMQQQKEEARRQQTVDDLENMGEAMHNNHEHAPEASSTEGEASSTAAPSSDTP